jgi:eukaryotic-like serine/threonine-protein kinase
VAEDRFGPYVVFERLGAGGMATVHRAEIELENDETREVALKRLLPQYADDKRFVEDLIREGKLAAQLEHPNIVRILELGRIGRTYFIAMDLVRGQSLISIMRQAFDRRMYPPIPIVIALMIEMLDALDHAHAAQIVHRDLSPSNLIVTEDGHLKIIDFGVAKALAGGLQTSSGLAKGKLGYMPLEAVSGKHIDQRADIFSAGVVMWELTTMKRLFQGATDIDLIDSIRLQHIEPPSTFNAEVPAELDALIMKALRQHRDERWETAGEMVDVLARLRVDHAATADDVVAWLEHLSHEPTQRGVEDGDFTELGGSVPDESGPPEDPVLAHGSDAGTYDDDLEPEIHIEESTPARFKDADTVVSVSMFHTRKP